MSLFKGRENHWALYHLHPHRHMGVNNLPRVVTWQRTNRKSNPRFLNRESNALTTRPVARWNHGGSLTFYSLYVYPGRFPEHSSVWTYFRRPMFKKDLGQSPLACNETENRPTHNTGEKTASSEGSFSKICTPPLTSDWYIDNVHAGTFAWLSVFYRVGQ